MTITLLQEIIFAKLFSNPIMPGDLTIASLNYTVLLFNGLAY